MELQSGPLITLMATYSTVSTPRLSHQQPLQTTSNFLFNGIIAVIRMIHEFNGEGIATDTNLYKRSKFLSVVERIEYINYLDQQSFLDVLAVMDELVRSEKIFSSPIKKKLMKFKFPFSKIHGEIVCSQKGYTNLSGYIYDTKLYLRFAI